MNLHDLIRFVHVLAAVVLLGSSLLLPFLRGAIRGAKDLDALRGLIELLRRASHANPAASMVLLASGLWLGSGGWWSAGWFQVALGLFLVSAVLALRFEKRGAIELGRAVATAGTGAVPAAIDDLRWSTAWALGASALLANDLAALFLMTNKPGLLGSLAAVAVAQGCVAAIYAARGGSRRAARPEASSAERVRGTA